MNTQKARQLSETIKEIVNNAAATQGAAFAKMLRYEIHTAQITRFVQIMVEAAKAGKLDEEWEDALICSCVEIQAEQFEQVAELVGFEDGDWEAVLDLANNIVDRIDRTEAEAEAED